VLSFCYVVAVDLVGDGAVPLDRSLADPTEDRSVPAAGVGQAFTEGGDGCGQEHPQGELAQDDQS
jgi:hypothetical protein